MRRNRLVLRSEPVSLVDDEGNWRQGVGYGMQ
jgi:hypothetical protein